MEKIKASHLSRLAIVYLRQSTLAQVEHNLESTKLQYSQDKRAEALGWEPDQIRVIDIDLGKSGRSIENRPGFSALMNLVANKKVGIILVNELSRLSRDSEDWSRFIKFCQKTNTLIADYESVYDPNNPSDWIALGIRGTLSGAEFFTNRVRLQETRRNKAREGKLEILQPTGLIWKNKEIVFDPEKEVQSCIQLLFDLLEKYGAAWSVLQHCVENNILIPTRHSKDNKSTSFVTWGKARKPRLYSIFHHPSYAGAYAHGRTKREEFFDKKEEKFKTKIIRLPIDQWETLIVNHHPGYITWERFLEIQNLLEKNCCHNRSGNSQTKPREGRALLQGILICGRCGRPMRVHYAGNYIQYRCDDHCIQDGGVSCWSTSGNVIDEAIGNHVLQLLNVEQLDLSVAVLDEIKRERQKQDHQWELRLKQSEDAVKHAKRRHELVNPENRRVAAQLEQEWNDKLEVLERLQEAFDQEQKDRNLELSDEQQQQIFRLVDDYPAVWHALTTTAQQRKELLRLLVKQVSLAPVTEDKGGRQIKILWHTSAISELYVNTRIERLSESTLQLIKQFVANGISHSVIAQELNKRGIKGAKGQEFTKTAIDLIFWRKNIAKETT